VEELLDQPQLRVPTDERRLQPVNALRTTDPGQDPAGSPQRLRNGFALQLVPAGGREAHGCFRYPAGAAVDQDCPRFGDGLHPRGGVHGIPGHHPLTERSDRDRNRPRHHTGPSGQPVRSRLLPKLGNSVNQLQRGAHGPLAILFGCQRGSPHRHHRVPDELLHDSAVAADDRARLLEVPGQQLPDLLRVPRLAQRGEPHKVAEEHGTDPTLSHWGRRGGELLRDNSIEWRLGRHHRSANSAESLAWRRGRATRHAGRSQGRPAVFTERLAVCIPDCTNATGGHGVQPIPKCLNTGVTSFLHGGDEGPKRTRWLTLRGRQLSGDRMSKQQKFDQVLTNYYGSPEPPTRSRGCGQICERDDQPTGGGHADGSPARAAIRLPLCTVQ
jgi:hypothetical protein